MISSDKKAVQLILEHCVVNGVSCAVFSPGSRNAPLAIAADHHPDIQTYVVHDERSAAFFALGMAQQLNAPVAIVCTSGSAPANYYPAVVEAYYQQIPLVIITADRPKQWIDQGDGQTINQEGMFGPHVRYAVQINDHIVDSTDVWQMNRELARAFVHANAGWRGPIHINVALSEPLYSSTEITRPIVNKLNYFKGKFHFDAAWLEAWKLAMRYKKKMVVVGQMPPDPQMEKALSVLASDPSIAFLVENTANIKGSHFIHCIDRVLETIKPEEIHEFQPEIVISFGGAVVSKRIKSFLRQSPLVQHWRVGQSFPFMDTYQFSSHIIDASPLEFLNEVNDLPKHPATSNYGNLWKQRDYLSQEAAIEYVRAAPFSDLTSIHTLLDYLPDHSQLHMANSSIVRYCQLFDPINSVTYWSNRGTSGIDGSSSTAVGSSVAAPNELHVLITGDISFLYDSNAWWNAYLASNLRILLVNNGGGGIFKIIEGANSSPQTTVFFEARHEQNAEDLARAFQLHYQAVHSIDEIESSMESFYTFEENGRPKLMEIFTPREENHLFLKDFFSAVAASSNKH
jgi:2-succinyl-5-enolpyruvyl-6-hydroxy-3-cyclohexene-1-carboxylate synthase